MSLKQNKLEGIAQASLYISRKLYTAFHRKQSNWYSEFY